MVCVTLLCDYLKFMCFSAPILLVCLGDYNKELGGVRDKASSGRRHPATSSPSQFRPPRRPWSQRAAAGADPGQPGASCRQTATR